MNKRDQNLLDEYNIRFPIDDLDQDILSLLSLEADDSDHAGVKEDSASTGSARDA